MFIIRQITSHNHMGILKTNQLYSHQMLFCSCNKPIILPISNMSYYLLKEQMKSLKLQIHTTEDLLKLSKSLINKENKPCRVCIIACTPEDAKQQLNHTDVIVEPNTKHILSFLYTGQGSQYSNMSKMLYEQSKIFQKTINDCSNSIKIKPLLHDILYSDSPLINDTKYTQSILFILEYSLTKLLEKFNVKADIVLGHSLGEYTAATISNIMSFHDALHLIYYRSELISQLEYNISGMLSIFSDLNEINKVINDSNLNLSIAAINGPKSIVCSGFIKDLKELQSNLKRKKIKSKFLTVSHAFHSKLQLPILSPFYDYTKTIKYNKPANIIISNITGEYSPDYISTPEYWRDHIISTVQFEKSIINLNKRNSDIIIEIGPKPTLINMAKRCIVNNNNDIDFLSLLYKDQYNNIESILNVLKFLYLKNYDINWKSILDFKYYNI